MCIQELTERANVYNYPGDTLRFIAFVALQWILEGGVLPGIVYCDHHHIGFEKLSGISFSFMIIKIDNVKVSLDEVQYDPENCVFIVPKGFVELHICGE